MRNLFLIRCVFTALLSVMLAGCVFAQQASVAQTTIGVGCDCDPTVFAYCRGTSIEQTRGASTIGYTFASPVYCGTFANGYDFWVAPEKANDAVVLVSTTPAAISSGANLLNGVTINPTMSGVSNLDGRLNAKSNSLVLPYTIVTRQVAASSIIKAESRVTGGNCRVKVNGVQRMCFDQLDVLTVLNEVPAHGGKHHLRPPFFGTDKYIRTRDDIAVSRLPNIPKQKRHGGVIEPTVALQTCVDLMTGIKVGWGRDYPNTEVFKANENWPGIGNGYSPVPFGKLWQCAQWLYVDPTDFGVTAALKHEFAYRFVEHGYDVCQIAEYYDREDAPWTPNGGHGVGRYGLCAVAAALTDDEGALAAMLTKKVSTALGVQSFAETGQIYAVEGVGYGVYGNKTVAGGKISQSCLKSKNQITVDPLGLVDNGDMQYYGNKAWPARCATGPIQNYQNIFTPIAVSQAIVLAMIPAAQAIADKKLLAYADRMLMTGVKAYQDDTPGNAIIDVKAYPYCVGGASNGLLGFKASDCPGGKLVNDLANFKSKAYNSIFGVFMYEVLRPCLATLSCKGQ